MMKDHKQDVKEDNLAKGPQFWNTYINATIICHNDELSSSLTCLEFFYISVLTANRYIKFKIMGIK